MGGDGDDDDALFRKAMHGVVRIDRTNPRTPPPGSSARSTPIVSERPSFQVERSAGRIEGRAPGVSEKTLAKLRAGGWAVARRVDLHGQRREVAIATVTGRIQSAVHDGHRCLLFVHGRGKHSGGTPVLRDAVVEALCSGDAARCVRAFSTALPKDGGAGAMYVLLAAKAKVKL